MFGEIANFPIFDAFAVQCFVLLLLASWNWKTSQFWCLFCFGCFLGETADFSLLMLCCWLSVTANFPKVWCLKLQISQFWCFCCLLTEIAKSSLSSDTFANLLKWNCWILSHLFYSTKISQGCKIKKIHRKQKNQSVKYILRIWD